MRRSRPVAASSSGSPAAGDVWTAVSSALTARPKRLRSWCVVAFVEFRRLARPFRHGPDRLLHPLRRWRAIRRLRKTGLPRSILFVCYGNICRSPYAEHSLARCLPPFLRDRIEIDSAGFFGVGRGSPPEAVMVAGFRGVDLSNHRARMLTPDDGVGASWIFVMNQTQERAIRRRFGRTRAEVLLLGDLDSQRIDTRTVFDPVDRPPEVFAEVYARIDRCLGVVVRAMLSDVNGIAPGANEVRVVGTPPLCIIPGGRRERGTAAPNSTVARKPPIPAPQTSAAVA